ncbi:MAG: MFS transporter [Gemmatimonadetes bacterium]|nr:MFS transporter [Gemmatimonadota bacterium]
MPGTDAPRETAARLYAFLMEEEDARVCKDIPEQACTDVPSNFFKLGTSQTLTKLADELSSAKTVLPWVLASLGSPPGLIGFLVPIREAGSLLPQLLIAAAVRSRPLRKRVWVLGGVLQALTLLGMCLIVVFLQGLPAGLGILALLVLFSLARGLVSVASKDVTGKTIPKTRRGRLTGFTSALSGLLTLALGAILTAFIPGDPGKWALFLLLCLAAGLWLSASGVFITVQETPGATEGGKDAVKEALARLSLLKTDAVFRRFVWVRALLVSTGLAAPFYVTLARESSSGGNLLGFFVIASGLAVAVASGFWGRLSDRSSRAVLVSAALMASTLGVTVFLLDSFGLVQRFPWTVPVAFFCLAIAHSGIRIGRKTYLLDMASGVRRTDFVAVSNSVIGVVLLLGGALGLLAPILGPAGILLLFSALGFSGAWGARKLPETQ